MKALVASALLAVTLAAVPTLAVADGWLEPSVATTYRLDHAGHGQDHWPACTGQTNGTAHHSCGSLTGGPAGGLF